MSAAITTQGHSVGLAEIENLIDASRFDLGTSSTENNHGMLGIFSVETADGEFGFRAELQSKNPDNSDDDLRADQNLTVTVTRLSNGDFVQSSGDYEYHGDDPGDHLEGIGVEEMIEDLANGIKRQAATPRP
jgi:hypothetical protein